VSPIVHIHKSFVHLIPGILDQGIMGIQVSEVDNAEEARAIVREAKYPPIGKRGIAGQGMHTGYKSYGARHLSEYATWTNANVIVCPSIESLEGLKNVEAIAAIEGIDMIASGHSDLSARLGVHLDLEHPSFKAAVRRIAEATWKACSGLRGDGSADRGILAARVQGVEPAWQRCQHLSRWLKARAGRAHARLKSIAVPTP
jgi:2-keto-3-deoxy-L-rhamnonate aldolase RhmA